MFFLWTQMKKVLISFVALMLCFQAFSQDSESSANYAGLTLIPRLDLTPYYSKADGAWGFSHGNSSIYTLFEGSASEYFSWTLANHWISTGRLDYGDDFEYGWPYTSLGYSNTTNLIDLCFIDLTFDNWMISLGKDMILTGGFEYDDWDWDVHPEFATSLWNGLPVYQWGGKVTYTTPNEGHEFAVQATTSPFAERFFTKKLLTASAQYKKYGEVYEVIASASMLGYDPAIPSGAPDFYPVFFLGQRVYLGDWTITLDLSNNNCFASNEDETVSYLRSGVGINAALTWAPSDKIELTWRGLHSRPLQEFTPPGETRWNTGLICHYYPLKDSDALRIHAYANYDNIGGDSNLTFSLGIRYNFLINLW